MIKIEFTDAEQEAINYERYNHPHPRVQRKMEALGGCGKIIYQFYNFYSIIEMMEFYY